MTFCIYRILPKAFPILWLMILTKKPLTCKVKLTCKLEKKSTVKFPLPRIFKGKLYFGAIDVAKIIGGKRMAVVK